MSDLQTIKGILKNTAVVAKKCNYTYVNRLFMEFGESPTILLICKKITSPTNESVHEMPDVTDDFLKSQDHDVTGSPLRHSFGDDEFNVTIPKEKRNWSKEEEYHFPLRKLQASAIINLCLDTIVTKWTLPMFVLCDGTDPERTLMLGAFVESEWFSTMRVCSSGLMGSSKIHDCSLPMKEHLKLSSVDEREVKVAIWSLYEFHGIDKTMIDWSENEKVNFEGYLSLELTWNSLLFSPPIRTSSNYLIAQVAAGWKSSPLRDLWDQLLLLDKYLEILQAYQEKNMSSRYSVLPLSFPKNFNTPYTKESDDILERLKLLLIGDDAFENDDPHCNASERQFSTDADLDDNALLSSYIKELSSRQNLDFTDQLWQLVRGSCNYAQLTDCLHAVFEEIVDNHYKPKINGTQPTLLANLFAKLNSQNATVPSLAGSLPLELVIDMGMEKMSRDYQYLLLSANLAELHGVQKKLSHVSTEQFSAVRYRKRLIIMAQIHLCLEFLLLVQDNLDCSMDMSHSLFDNAAKLYVSDESPVKSFVDLIDNTIYTLKAPGSYAILKEVVKTSPSSWRSTLSSVQRASRITTTTHCSLVPIFPPNIYSPEDPIDGEENFHVTKVVCSSYKVNDNCGR